MEVKRPVREVVALIDTDDEMPSRGQTVFALSLGGKLCEIVWLADSHKHFHAWMPFPKVPKAVKEKLTALYDSGQSWGSRGTPVHRDE